MTYPRERLRDLDLDLDRDGDRERDRETLRMLDREPGDAEATQPSFSDKLLASESDIVLELKTAT